MKKTIYSLLAVVFASLSFTSCIDDVFKPKSYKELSGQYVIVYDAKESNGEGSWWPVAKFIAGDGMPSELDGGTVYFNDTQLILSKQGYEYSTTSKKGLPTGMQGEFILNTPDGKTYTNTAVLKSIRFDASMPIVEVNRNQDFTFQFIGDDLTEHDYVFAYLKEKDGTVIYTNKLSYDKEKPTNKSITFSKDQLSILPSAEYLIVLEYYNVDELEEDFGLNGGAAIGIYSSRATTIQVVDGPKEEEEE